MTMNEKLVQLRKDKGVTQIELAEALNVSRQAVSKWESGGALPSTEKLICLSKLYGVSIDYLINDESESPVPTETKEEPVCEKEEPVCEREETAREKKHIKWMICLVCVLIAIIVILGAKLAALQNKPEVLTFDMIEEEDWNGLEVTEIPMEWPW